MLKYDSFSFTAIFSLLWTLRFDVFTVFKLPLLWVENNIDLWFSPICGRDCTLQNGMLISTCKNFNIRLVSCR